jgi:ribonuclease HI
VKLPKLNPATWARDILDPSLIKKYDAAVVVSVMWAIWGSRNKYNHGEEKYQPLKSMELVYEFVKSLDIPMTESVIADSIIPRWKRPPAGWLKINTDGAISALESSAGAGIVVRDDAGEVVMVEGHKYSHISDPFIAEMLACRDAMLLARSKGWLRVAIETDCQTIVKVWNGGNEQRSPCSQLVREMKCLLSNFQGFSISFVKREANKVAHACARAALSLDVYVVSYDTIPGFLAEDVQLDFMSSIE